MVQINTKRIINFNLILCLSKNASEIILLRRRNQIEKNIQYWSSYQSKNIQQRIHKLIYKIFQHSISKEDCGHFNENYLKEKSGANLKFKPGIDVNLDQAVKRDKFSFRLRNKENK